MNDEYKGKGDKYGPTPSDSGDEYTDDEYTESEEEDIKKPLNIMGSDQYVDRVEKFTPAPGAPISGYRPVPVRILIASFTNSFSSFVNSKSLFILIFN